jgi:hypothetical protein
MRYASARGLAMNAAFNNNLPNQTNYVMVNPRNPENPDSNFWLLLAQFPPKIRCILIINHKNHNNQKNHSSDKSSLLIWDIVFVSHFFFFLIT